MSFYDILVAKGNKLADYMSNENIAEALETGNYKNEFPMYADEIESQYQEGMKRKNLVNAGKICIQHSDIGAKLPEEICEKIAEHLDNITIHKLVYSAFQNTQI